MPHYALFLRAVNVGGTGRLSMETLRAIATKIGGTNPQTYIASGNLALTYDGGADTLRRAMETALEDYAGKPIGVIVRQRHDLDALLDNMPFAAEDPARTLCLLTDDPIPADPILDARNLTSEQVLAGPGALYMFYPEGQGKSRLTLPQMKSGTARNANTIQRMRDMLAKRP